jgi:hypothetical protein
VLGLRRPDVRSGRRDLAQTFSGDGNAQTIFQLGRQTSSTSPSDAQAGPAPLQATGTSTTAPWTFDFQVSTGPHEVIAVGAGKDHDPARVDDRRCDGALMSTSRTRRR